MQFTDTKLKAGTKYTYKVRAYTTYKQKQWYNKKSKKWVTKKPKKKYRGKKRKVTVKVYGPYSAAKLGRTKAKTATPAPSPAPAAEPLVITGLKADMGYISGQVSWNSAPKATQYRVSVNGTSQEVTKSCSYALVNLQPRTSYTIAVVAENSSATGKAVENTYKTTNVPTPGNIKYTASDNSITLSWNPVAGADGYYINSNISSLKKYTDTTSCVINGLERNTTYTFYVQAYIGNGYSDKTSGKITATTGAQAPGSIKPPQITSKTAILPWSAVSGADSYRILDSNKNIVDTTTSCSYMLTGLKENSTQNFYIVAGKSGSYGVATDANKVQVVTKESPLGFNEKKNISLSYHGVDIHLGEKWGPGLLSSLRSVSNGYEKLSRPGYAHDGINEYDATEYMFDVNDYSDFLEVLVADGKIIRWRTNGPVFGTYYGKEIGWGDAIGGCMHGRNMVHKNSSEKSSTPFGTLNRGDAVIGEFSFTIWTDISNLIIKNEKRIGFHYINAYRVAAEHHALEYSEDLDGTGRIWSGYAKQKQWVDTQYGAQPLAETLTQSDMQTHMTENATAGPLKGQTMSERWRIIKAATGVEVDSENLGTGCAGEGCITLYQDDTHFGIIHLDLPTKVGIGMGVGVHAEIYGR